MTHSCLTAGRELANPAEHIDAFCYGAGDGKLGQIAINDAKEAGKAIPKGATAKIGKDLRHRLQSGITGMSELVEKCKRAHNTRSALPGLDDRWIPSNSDHSALNTLLQGNGAIVMKQALVCLHEALQKSEHFGAIGYTHNVHDEVGISCPPEAASFVVDAGKKAITDAGILLSVRCPLVGDGKVGANWYETH